MGFFTLQTNGKQYRRLPCLCQDLHQTVSLCVSQPIAVWHTQWQNVGVFGGGLHRCFRQHCAALLQLVELFCSTLSNPFWAQSCCMPCEAVSSGLQVALTCRYSNVYSNVCKGFYLAQPRLLWVLQASRVSPCFCCTLKTELLL